MSEFHIFRGHYDRWIESRMNGVKKYIKPGFFENKTLLELGCGHAHVGNKFSELGAMVTSCDARAEHLQIVNALYPHIKTFVLDGDRGDVSDKYDIVVHWGLLYHLCEIEKHLKKIAACCDVLILETEVADSTSDTFFIPTSERGDDQAFNNVGIRPSPSYVERVLQSNGFNFKLIKDGVLDAEYHTYAWDHTESKSWRDGLRRFWVCWKGDASPMRDPQ